MAFLRHLRERVDDWLTRHALRGVPILRVHPLASATRAGVTRPRLDAFLAFIHASGRRPVGLVSLLGGHLEVAPPTPPPLLLTIDAPDGAGLGETLIPAMQRREGASGVVFLDPLQVPPTLPLTTLLGCGLVAGVFLPARQPAHRVRETLREGRERLAQRLGYRPRLLATDATTPSPLVQREAREAGYPWIMTRAVGLASPGDATLLPRLPITPTTRISTLRRLLDTDPHALSAATLRARARQRTEPLRAWLPDALTRTDRTHRAPSGR